MNFSIIIAATFFMKHQIDNPAPYVLDWWYSIVAGDSALANRILPCGIKDMKQADCSDAK